MKKKIIPSLLVIVTMLLAGNLIAQNEPLGDPPPLPEGFVPVEEQETERLEHYRQLDPEVALIVAGENARKDKISRGLIVVGGSVTAVPGSGNNSEWLVWQFWSDGSVDVRNARHVADDFTFRSKIK